MKLTVEKALELQEKSENLKTDLDLLKFAKENRGLIKVVLDNDSSWLEFTFNDEMSDKVEEIISDIELPQFRDYHYWSDGVILLFDFAGIEAESC